MMQGTRPEAGAAVVQADSRFPSASLRAGSGRCAPRKDKISPGNDKVGEDRMGTSQGGKLRAPMMVPRTKVDGYRSVPSNSLKEAKKASQIS